MGVTKVLIKKTENILKEGKKTHKNNISGRSKSKLKRKCKQLKLLFTRVYTTVHVCNTVIVAHIHICA